MDGGWVGERRWIGGKWVDRQMDNEWVSGWIDGAVDG